jgi:membrane protease YdiL (CAAX protease family)
LSSVVGGIPALLIASAWFAAIHFSAVEMIGLALAGLLFGAALQTTGRLGASILAHVGFNVAGVVLALQ